MTAIDANDAISSVLSASRQDILASSLEELRISCTSADTVKEADIIEAINHQTSIAIRDKQKSLVVAPEKVPYCSESLYYNNLASRHDPVPGHSSPLRRTFTDGLSLTYADIRASGSKDRDGRTKEIVAESLIDDATHEKASQHESLQVMDKPRLTPSQRSRKTEHQRSTQLPT